MMNAEGEILTSNKKTEVSYILLIHAKQSTI